MRLTRRPLRYVLGPLLCLVLAACAGTGRQTMRDQQVDYGAGVFRYDCARCHAPGRSVATLTGPALSSHFATAQDVYDFVRRSMPLDRPGTLAADDYWAVVANVLATAGLLGLPADRALDPATAPNIVLTDDPIVLRPTTTAVP